MNQETNYQPKIMGVVNVTPDSFSDGGDFSDKDKAILYGLQLIKEGADILDIGGESTRPGAEPVPIAEEIERVVPVISGLRKETDLPISIDTRNAAVMQEALAVGATMVNDVTALTYDKQALATVSQSGVAICLMHIQGEPGTMQSNPTYQDVVAEVFSFLENRVRVALVAGVKKEAIYIDVGIGFGKTLEHNLSLLKNLQIFQQLEVKMILGTSRKSFIEKIIKTNTKPKERLSGSLASLVPALEAKVDILRVHDVKETKQFVTVYKRIVE